MGINKELHELSMKRFHKRHLNYQRDYMRRYRGTLPENYIHSNKKIQRPYSMGSSIERNQIKKLDDIRIKAMLLSAKLHPTILMKCKTRKYTGTLGFLDILAMEENKELQLTYCKKYGYL